MKSEILKYESKEKVYEIEKKKKPKLFLCFLLLLPFFIISAICIYNSFSKTESGSKIEYYEMGNTDYKVYLKDNEYYGKSYLDSNDSQMNYISSLINTINIDFNYKINSALDLNYDYKYKIDAELIITDPNDKEKIVYTKNYPLVEETTNKLTNKNLEIVEEVDIDYNEYNDYVNKYLIDYSLTTADSKLIVTMELEANGSASGVDNKIASNKTFSVTIPLAERTISITKSDDFKNNDMLSKDVKTSLQNPILFAIGFAIGFTSIVVYGIIFVYWYNSRKPKNLYDKTIQKYLKEYDRYIIECINDHGNSNIYPNRQNRTFIENYEPENIVRVKDIKELIDYHESTGKAILHYEVEPHSKSYFIIPTQDYLYKLTISQAWLMKNEKEKNSK